MARRRVGWRGVVVVGVVVGWLDVVVVVGWLDVVVDVVVVNGRLVDVVVVG